MRAIYDITTLHIEVTNACNLECSCCTRFCGHHVKPFMMSLEMVERALQSLADFPHNIGIMGGEPTLHPQFAEICRLVQRYVPKERRGFWTNGARWDRYRDLILETFFPENIVYNDHTAPEGHHHPLLCASEEIVADPELRRDLIENCWIQKRWSASITPKGGFFCEVAAALDMLFDGPGGYPIEPGWWKKTPADFQDQVERYCRWCSAAVPMKPVDARLGKDLVSPGVAELLDKVQSPRYRRGCTEVFSKVLTAEEIEELRRDWRPWSHRPFRQCGPDMFLDDDGRVVHHKVFHAGK